MDYTQYIKSELLLIIPVLYIIGAVIKNTETIKDKYIPIILTVVGIGLSSLYVIGTEGINTMSIFTAIVQGILCAGGAVLGNQTIKQLSEDK